MKNIISISAAFLLLLYGCGESPEKAEKRKQAEQFAENMKLEQEIGSRARGIFQALPVSADNPENPVTEAKVKLGKILYYDTRLSKEGKVSCNTCHVLSSFGVDNLPLSKGDGGMDGDRNSPTVFNAAFHTTQFWDGRAKDVEEQAGMPILEDVEMAIPSEDFLVKRLSGIELYQKLFAEAFPGEKKPVTYANLEKAIGAFERTLVVPSSFDEYLNGSPNALTLDEKKGLKTFMDAGCITCHTGSLAGGNMFQKFGVFYDYWTYTKSAKIDEGRFIRTNNEGDKYMFKVPSLRHVAKTYPYFHDGSIQSLEEAVKIIAKVNLNKDLTDEEVKSIVTFMNSFTGDIPAGVGDTPEELKTSM